MLVRAKCIVDIRWRYWYEGETFSSELMVTAEMVWLQLYWEKQPKSSSLSNALYMTSSNLDKIRVFIRNVSCTKCPKNRPFLRSQITVWLYKVWVAFLSRQKGLLKVNHRWSPDVQGESIPLFQDKLCQKASQSWSSLITRCPHLAHWLGRCLGKSPMGSQSLSHSWRK